MTTAADMRVLLTAFEPYAEWKANSSWLALMELLRLRPATTELITRRYPVDFSRMQACLERDLALGFDAVLHLGQAPGSSTVKLEAFAVNAGNSINQSGDELHELVPHAPAAYRSSMPLGRWCDGLRKAGIPASLSAHAGTYLCNAVMYLSHHWHATRNLNVPVGFVHLPLASEQVAATNLTTSSLPLPMLAQAIAVILEDLQTSSQPNATLPSQSLA